MQRILFLLLTVAFFAACEKEADTSLDNDRLIEEMALSTDRMDVEPQNLPGSLRDFVSEQFFDTYIETAFQVMERGFALNLGNGISLFADEEGRILEFRGERPNDRLGPDGPHGPCHRLGEGFGRPVGISDLPNAIIRYINENYPEAEPTRAKWHREHFIVLINRSVVLVFDEQGAFVNEISPLNDCYQPCRPIRFEQLPESAQSYIQDNYPEDEFKIACARRGKIAVFLLHEPGRRILIFDVDGNFLFERG